MSNLGTQRSSRPVAYPARALCNLAAGALAVAALLLGPRADAAGAAAAPAAKADIDALRSHIEGCRLEFWRAMALQPVEFTTPAER